MIDALAPRPHAQVLTGFGGAVRAVSHFVEVASVDELRSVVLAAAARRAAGEAVTVAFRGAGRSYGDAALGVGESSVVVGMARMNRVLAWDPTTGVIDVEAGCTIEDVWRATIGDGYWPPVVPGTMRPTIGGCVAMNIHGKNNFKVGSIGEHVTELDLMTADGAVRTLGPAPHQEPALFRAVVGGMGLLGAITRVRLRMAKVPSGTVRVMPIIAHNLEEAMARMEARTTTSDYLVGWIDCFARGSALGRGLIHAASYVRAENQASELTTRASNLRGLPRRIFGFPKAHLWRLMRPLTNRWLVPWVNAAKYWSAALAARFWAKPKRESLVAFNFLLDYVANWERAYGAGGLIQYQVFVPHVTAGACLREVLELCQAARHVPLLGVLKRHRADGFLLSHGVDGWSLALDFKVGAHAHPARGTPRGALGALFERLTARVLAAGGRFYFAKDAVLQAPDAAAFLGGEAMATLAAFKRQLDPAGLWQTALATRLSLS